MAAGVVAAVLFSVLVLCALLAATIVSVWWTTRNTSGGLGAVSAGISEAAIYVVPVVGFAIGFYWQFRRRARAGRPAK
ncbi:MAG: hypothetical protein A3H96_02635 [Acidobacteria bacterium RIFCSPLOWO2_02_FULL_67_36]|nr:MAG: hypothetical protein A3H96_02635 [Acidobacteria bacterium RIFCSPLOWO2_02_FULL_67_36]OFW26127.1 MAG: hypothetical protein A3G21_23955 [Acidobacteria bacterium RIFCSPLOWO2_12_FULL_66_21]